MHRDPEARHVDGLAHSYGVGLCSFYPLLRAFARGAITGHTGLTVLGPE